MGWKETSSDENGEVVDKTNESAPYKGGDIYEVRTGRTYDCEG